MHFAYSKEYCFYLGALSWCSLRPAKDLNLGAINHNLHAQFEPGLRVSTGSRPQLNQHGNELPPHSSAKLYTHVHYIDLLVCVSSVSPGFEPTTP
jgi:hypothetical protein